MRRSKVCGWFAGSFAGHTVEVLHRVCVSFASNRIVSLTRVTRVTVVGFLTGNLPVILPE